MEDNNRLIERKKRWNMVLFSGLALAGICAIALAVFSHCTGFEISFSTTKCFFPVFLHLYCPGCGGTRAVRYLMNGQIVSSFLAHPIVLYLLALYLQCLGMSVYDVFVKRDGVMRVRIYMWQLWALLGIVLVFFVVRNLAVVFWGYDFLGECVRFWQ